MIGLNRDLAPISEAAWKALDEEAASVLRLHLAGRRLVDFEGPLGWSHSAIDLGDVTTLEAGPSGAQLRQRRVRPLVELRVPFEVERNAVERIDRGARDVDLEGLRDAARLFAAAEDTALFEGYEDAGIPGLQADSANEGVALADDPAEWPGAMAQALEQLRQAGVGGPYALALGPEHFAALHRATADGGYPTVRHVARMLDEPPIWAPSLRGGLVASLRGGDFRFVCGRDAAIGYADHDADRIQLHLEESFSVELDGPEAVVPLLPADDER